MTQSSNYSVKTVFLAYYKALRDFVFPPFCPVCKEACETKLFCLSCWALCASPDPCEKCPHCFGDSDGLCRRCKRNPRNPFVQAFVFEDTESAEYLAKHAPEAMFAFAIHQWGCLDWPVPDVVVPMPGSWEFANKFSEAMGSALTDDLESIDFDQVILVLDVGSSMEQQERKIRSLAEACPKRGFLLSLFRR